MDFTLASKQLNSLERRAPDIVTMMIVDIIAQFSFYICNLF